jgi:hypothetical protein
LTFDGRSSTSWQDVEHGRRSMLITSPDLSISASAIRDGQGTKDVTWLPD